MVLIQWCMCGDSAGVCYDVLSAVDDCLGCEVTDLNYEGALADGVTIWIVEDNNQLLQGVSQ
jgi:hypothetical protein